MNQGNTPDGGLNWIWKKDYYSEILTIKIQGLIKTDNTIIGGFKGGKTFIDYIGNHWSLTGAGLLLGSLGPYLGSFLDPPLTITEKKKYENTDKQSMKQYT